MAGQVIGLVLEPGDAPQRVKAGSPDPATAKIICRDNDIAGNPVTGLIRRHQTAGLELKAHDLGSPGEPVAYLLVAPQLLDHLTPLLVVAESLDPDLWRTCRGDALGVAPSVARVHKLAKGPECCGLVHDVPLA